MTLLAQINFGELNQEAIPNLEGAAGGLSLGLIVTRIMNYVYPLAGLGLLIYLIFGGVQMLTSAGDPKAAESAKKKITGALIGFVIIFVSFWLTRIVSSILGLSDFGDIF